MKNQLSPAPARRPPRPDSRDDLPQWYMLPPQHRRGLPAPPAPSRARHRKPRDPPPLHPVVELLLRREGLEARIRRHARAEGNSDGEGGAVQDVSRAVCAELVEGACGTLGRSERARITKAMEGVEEEEEGRLTAMLDRAWTDVARDTPGGEAALREHLGGVPHNGWAHSDMFLLGMVHALGFTAEEAGERWALLLVRSICPTVRYNSNPNADAGNGDDYRFFAHIPNPDGDRITRLRALLRAGMKGVQARLPRDEIEELTRRARGLRLRGGEHNGGDEDSSDEPLSRKIANRRRQKKKPGSAIIPPRAGRSLGGVGVDARRAGRKRKRQEEEDREEVQIGGVLYWTRSGRGDNEGDDPDA
ncbi:hypothetical protein F4810DRAFT_715359 [Camillea tinctor]|nr:hypothetical protein F4810DRAFT_715359 [Camillea tinctor]